MAMVVVAWFCIPELKGRTLEEIDQLFLSGQPLRKFRQIETTPVEEMYAEEVGNDLKETSKAEHID